MGWEIIISPEPQILKLVDDPSSGPDFSVTSKFQDVSNIWFRKLPSFYFSHCPAVKSAH